MDEIENIYIKTEVIDINETCKLKEELVNTEEREEKYSINDVSNNFFFFKEEVKFEVAKEENFGSDLSSLVTEPQHIELCPKKETDFNDERIYDCEVSNSNLKTRNCVENSIVFQNGSDKTSKIKNCTKFKYFKLFQPRVYLKRCDKISKLNHLTNVKHDLRHKNDCYNSSIKNNSTQLSNYHRKRLICKVCNKSLKSSLSRHLLTHSGQKSAYCRICKKSFMRKDDMERHMLLHSGKKLFHCNICKRSFARKCSLNRHMAIHSWERPYSCNMCDKTYTHIDSLKIHQVIHSGKSFPCSICKESFEKKFFFKKHMHIHFDMKPFSCNICNDCFMQKEELKDHMLSHFGQKLFFCNNCNKPFLRKSDLNKHMLIHSKKKSFACNICDKPFFNILSLTRHLLIHSRKKS